AFPEVYYMAFGHCIVAKGNSIELRGCKPRRAVHLIFFPGKIRIPLKSPLACLFLQIPYRRFYRGFLPAVQKSRRGCFLQSSLLSNPVSDCWAYNPGRFGSLICSWHCFPTTSCCVQCVAIFFETATGRSTIFLPDQVVHRWLLWRCCRAKRCRGCFLFEKYRSGGHNPGYRASVAWWVFQYGGLTAGTRDGRKDERHS